MSQGPDTMRAPPLGLWLAQTARSYVGTQCKRHGRQPGAGMDCVGVWICALRDCGVVPPSFDVTGYPDIASGDLIARRIAEHAPKVLLPIRQAEMDIGDFLVVSYTRKGAPQHVGIVYEHWSGKPGMVHADNLVGGERGRIVETRLLFDDWMKFAAAYRVQPCS
jgi:cell wall-associated NlpC family hydrolase